jgi:hypothetical protein
MRWDIHVWFHCRIDKAKRVRGVSGTAHCFFNPDDATYGDPDSGESSSNFIDFGPFIDQVMWFHNALRKKMVCCSFCLGFLLTA